MHLTKMFILLLFLELRGVDIEAQHCVAEHIDGSVYLSPLSGDTSINTDIITCKTKLTHGILTIHLVPLIFLSMHMQVILFN